MLRAVVSVVIFLAGTQSFAIAYDTQVFSNELINGFYRNHLAVDVDKKVIGAFGAGTTSVKSSAVTTSGDKTIFTIRQERYGEISTDTWSLSRDRDGYISVIEDRKKKADRDILRRISLNKDGTLSSVITQNLTRGPTKVATLSYSKELCDKFRSKVQISNQSMRECADIAKSYDDLQAGIAAEIKKQGYSVDKQASSVSGLKNIFTTYDSVCQVPPHEAVAMASLADSRRNRARVVEDFSNVQSGPTSRAKSNR